MPSMLPTPLNSDENTGQLLPFLAGATPGGGRPACLLHGVAVRITNLREIGAARTRRHLRHDAPLEELRDRSGKEVSLVCVHNTFKKLGFTLKKSLYVRTSSGARMSPHDAGTGANG